MEEKWTILRVLQWTTDYFKAKGIEQPRPNAEVLLADALGLERIGLYLHYDQPLTKDELTRFRKYIERRVAGEPAQYIIGRQEFWSLSFEVNPAVLIPRPETERLVETVLEVLPETPCRILDLGTGSGAIAVALAKERPNWLIAATDISEQAIRVAVRNAHRHGVRDRIRFVLMDLLGAWNERETRFDAIVSNPPYVTEDEFKELTTEVRDQEPALALLGGEPDGLETIRRIISAAPRFLTHEGHLLLEIGRGQDRLLEPLAATRSYFTQYRFIKDYSGINRVAHLTRNHNCEAQVSHG